MSPDRCARCGQPGHDRRTLWMACLYAMNELKVPFKQVAILGRRREKTGEEPSKFFGPMPVWGEPSEEERMWGFFTLLVCKRCRAEWMEAIQTWFHAPPQGEDHDSEEYAPESPADPLRNIPYRENGRTIMLTEEEWRARRAASPAPTTK